MSAKVISDELLEQVGKDLRKRYGLDAEDVRRLGARLADDPHVQRRAENFAFAERLTRGRPTAASPTSTC
jgi:hypothetical protein